MLKTRSICDVVTSHPTIDSKCKQTNLGKIKLVMRVLMSPEQPVSHDKQWSLFLRLNLFNLNKTNAHALLNGDTYA